MSSYLTWLDSSQFPARHRVVFNFVSGNGAADGCNENDAPPSFDEALAQLDRAIAEEQIEARDLKCRFDGCSVQCQGDTVIIDMRIGPTQYYACMQDMLEAEQTAHNIQRGLQKYHDAKRYLACGMGVTVLPYTEDGRVLLGVRNGSSYSGWLHGVGGWLPFARNPALLDPLAHARLECSEELGIEDRQMEALEFLGLVSFKNSLETDIVFAMPIANELADAIVSRHSWKQAIDADEHEEFIAVPPSELWAKPHAAKLVPSSEFGLQALHRRQV